MSTDKSDEWEKNVTIFESEPWRNTYYIDVNRRRGIRIVFEDEETLDTVLADHAAARDLAQAQERIGDLEKLVAEKATLVYISWREKTFDLVEVFMRCPHCHNEEVLGEGADAYPRNPSAVIANFKHADDCWLTRATALLSPATENQEAEG